MIHRSATASATVRAEPERTRAICQVCGKSVSIHVPAGGDGSAMVLRKHRNRFQGKGSTVRCLGSYRYVKERS